MNKKLSLALTVLVAMAAMLLPTSAFADSITVTFSNNPFTLSAGWTTLTATLTASNANSGSVLINGDSFSINSPLTADDTVFLRGRSGVTSAGRILDRRCDKCVRSVGDSGRYLQWLLHRGRRGNAWSGDDLGSADFNAYVPPKPTSILLLGTGVIGVVARRFRRA